MFHFHCVLALALTRGSAPGLLLLRGTYLNEYLTTFIERQVAGVINYILWLCLWRRATNQNTLPISLQGEGTKNGTGVCVRDDECHPASC